MNFGTALEMMKLGLPMTRKSWREATVAISIPEHSLTQPFLCVRLGQTRSIWYPTTEDLLSDDWTLPHAEEPAEPAPQPQEAPVVTVKTPAAPYGVRKDGKPRGRPGRPKKVVK
jgi:hypothetical protein